MTTEDRIGPRMYWLSDESFEWFKTTAKEQKTSIRGLIDGQTPEWVKRSFVIKDKEIHDVIYLRRARRLYHPHDYVSYRIVNGDYNRWGHTIDLKVDTVAMLAQWTIKNYLPYRMGNPTAQGLAAIALEMIGRRWISDEPVQSE